MFVQFVDTFMIPTKGTERGKSPREPVLRICLPIGNVRFVEPPKRCFDRLQGQDRWRLGRSKVFLARNSCPSEAAGDFEAFYRLFPVPDHWVEFFVPLDTLNTYLAVTPRQPHGFIWSTQGGLV